MRTKHKTSGPASQSFAMAESNAGPSNTGMVDDSDPVIATYDVFIKPQSSTDRHIFVLQFPNTERHYSKDNSCEPLALRIKPKAGMVELDVPLNIQQHVDPAKAVKWGQALKKRTAKGEGSYGMPGGFGIGITQGAGRGIGRADVEHEPTEQELLRDFDRAVKNGQVLQKQTLGGQAVPNETTTPQYMVGTFQKGALHLTPVDRMVQLRPQFHYIDAQDGQERVGRRDPNALAARSTEARAVHMAVKSSIDGEDLVTDTMAERLANAQAEKWTNHKYIDEDETQSWYAYKENLFVRTDATRKVALKSALDDVAYIDTLSGARDAAKKSRSKSIRKPKPKSKRGQSREEVEHDSSSTISDMAERADDERMD